MEEVNFVPKKKKAEAVRSKPPNLRLDDLPKAAPTMAPDNKDQKLMDPKQEVVQNNSLRIDEPQKKEDLN